jgi:hypothetical protein
MTYMRWLWHFVRLPILSLLVVLEPVATFVCGGLALMGIMAVGFFELVGAPHFPMWTMLAISMSFVCALVLYEGAVVLFSE